MTHDSVNHPAHYTSDPSGVECIQITRHRTFNVGNAIKHLWRAGLKRDEGREVVDKQIEDLEKAIWYLNDEIKLLRGEADPVPIAGSYNGQELVRNIAGSVKPLLLGAFAREADCS